MTQEEKRIKIAEARGREPLLVCPNHSVISGAATPDKLFLKVCPWCSSDVHWEDFPDYFNNLHAMHEAELSLPPKLANQYVHALSVVLESQGVLSHTFALLTATASQRAEAFGLTLNLWKAGE